MCQESDADDMTLRARQELVKTKSPAELASITSFSDIPVPSKIENLLKGIVLAHNYKLFAWLHCFFMPL